MSASILETCKLLTRWAFEYFDQTTTGSTIRIDSTRHSITTAQWCSNGFMTSKRLMRDNQPRLVKILERPAGQQVAPFQGLLESGIAVGYVFLQGAQFVACKLAPQPI